MSAAVMMVSAMMMLPSETGLLELLRRRKLPAGCGGLESGGELIQLIRPL